MNTDNTQIYLCKADCSLLGTITGIKPETCSLKRNATDLWELNFEIDRYIESDGQLVQSDYYDSIDEMMRLFLDSDSVQAFFMIDSEPVISGDSYQEIKKVTAHSIECELCNMFLQNLKINCGTYDSQEYLACDTDNDGNINYYNVDTYTGLPYEYIPLINYGDPQLSLLHLALQNTGWSVKDDIPEDICKLKGCFESSDSVYSFLMKTVSPALSVIFEFDRKNKRIGIVKASDYGNDTGIFITMRNLMSSFEVTSSSNDSIKTKIVPTGANNLGIEQVNFGKDHIINLDYFMNTLSEYGDYKYVSKDLHDKYNIWKNCRDVEKVTYNDFHSDFCAKYNLTETYDDIKTIVQEEFKDEEGNDCQYTRRELYAKLTKLYNQSESSINELKNRVPNDGCFIDYTKFSLEELKQLSTAYDKAVAALKTCYKNDIIKEYNLPEKTIIDINEDKGDFSLTYTPEPEKSISPPHLPDTAYWYDYYAYKEKIIPQIKEALKMYCQTDEKGNLKTNSDGNYIELEYGNQKYYADPNIVNNIDSYLYEWFLYGLDELESKKKAWGECANLLFNECFVLSDSIEKPDYRTPDDSTTTGWNSLSPEQKSEFTNKEAFFNQLNQFLDYMSDDGRTNNLTGKPGKGIIRQCEAAIAARKEEINEQTAKKDYYDTLRKELASSTALENFEIKSPSLNNELIRLFTDKDLNVIQSMLRTQTYNNEHILTTSLDNTVSTVDKQEELYQNASEELYKISQPQYSFTTQLDNLYALDEFKAYQKPFDVGNFIRVGLEIHEELNDSSFIKLRLISITHNPLEKDAELSVEFSTMTKSLNEISDLAFLLDSESSSGSGSSSSSSGGSGTYGNNDANVQISNNMLNALLKTETFGTAVSDVILDTIKANKGNFNTLLSNSGIFNSLESGELKVSGDCLFDGVIQSGNFVAPNPDNTAAGSGACFKLTDGTFESYTTNGNYIINDGENLKIKMNNFQIDEEGNANFRGDITGSNGVIDGVFTGEVTGVVTGEVTGSINITPGLHIPNNYYLEICFEYTDHGNSTFDLEIEYYHVTDAGIELTTKTYYDFYYSPVAPDGGTGNTVSINHKISASEINGNKTIGINSINIICSDMQTAYPEIISLNIIDSNNKTVKSYNNNSNFTYSSNKLHINTALGLIKGKKLSINSDTGIINGKDYTGNVSGTININNNFIVENDGTTNCSNLNIIDGKFTHQIKRYTETNNIKESIWKDQDNNQYYRNLIMDDYGLSIETNRVDGLPNTSSKLLFKDRQFSLCNDDDGEISLTFSGSYDGDIETVANTSFIGMSTVNDCIKNIIDVNGIHGEVGGYTPLSDGVSIGGSGNTSQLSKYYIHSEWNYGYQIICTKAYEQKSFSGLSKRALYIGSDGVISAASSSRRYKQDISTELDEYFNPHLIYDLPVCQFRYNAENDGGNDSQLYIGFIAEDVAKHYPAAARWNKDHTEVDTWEMSDMFPAVVKLIQEQHKEIEKLKEEISDIKEKISNITT